MAEWLGLDPVGFVVFCVWGVVAVALIALLTYGNARWNWDLDGLQMMALVWPVALGLAIIVAPFGAIHLLGERQRKRDLARTQPPQQDPALAAAQAELDQYLGPPGGPET